MGRWWWIPTAWLLAVVPSKTYAQSSGGSPFDYDTRGTPVEVLEEDRVDRDGVVRRVLTFPSPVTGEVPALLFEPASGRPDAGLVLMHGIPGTRTSWAGLAEAYARLGVSVLAITGPYVRRDLPYREPRLIPAPLFEPWDSVEVVQATIDLRRAVELLAQESGFDRSRIGFVGHSFGAYLGGLVAAVEPRLGAVALMAPTNGWATWLRSHADIHFMKRAFLERPPAEQEAWLASLEPFEWAHWIGDAPGERLLVQLGERDYTVPEADTERLVELLPEGTTLRWYDAEHALDREAYTEQAVFLGGFLGFETEGFEAPAPPGG